jgi:hypothetical protein
LARKKRRTKESQRKMACRKTLRAKKRHGKTAEIASLETAYPEALGEGEAG